MEEANRPAPVPKDGITFEALIRNRDEVEHFKEFLNKKHARGEGKCLKMSSVVVYSGQREPS